MIKDNITYNDFSNLDIRVGKVVAASAPEWSDKLIRYEVYFGEEIGTRVLFSGIRKWYSPSELEGKLIPVIVNMAPKKMGEEESVGMTIMMDTEEKPILIFLGEGVEPGTIIR